MSSFWGAEVKPGKPYTHSARCGRLRLTQATLGGEVGKGEKGGGGGKKGVVQVQCSVKNKDPVFLCALVPKHSETCHLELEFEEKFVTISVLGPRSVYLAGYFVGDVYEKDMGDSDTGGDSLRGSDDDGFLDTDDDDDDNTVIIPVCPEEMSTDGKDDDPDYDSETDDAEMMYNQRRGKVHLLLRKFKRMTSLLVVKDRRDQTRKEAVKRVIILNFSLLSGLHLLNPWKVKMMMAFLYHFLNQRKVLRVVRIKIGS